MFGDALAEVVNSITAESIAQMLGVAGKDLNIIGVPASEVTSKSKIRKRRMLNQKISNQRVTKVTPSVWAAMTKKITLQAADIQEAQVITQFLIEQNLLPKRGNGSLFHLKPGTYTAKKLLKARSIKALLKSQSGMGKRALEKSPHYTGKDLTMFYLVAGDVMHGYKDFSEYQLALLDAMGINDKTVKQLSEKVNITEIADKLIDQLDDEILGDMF